MNRGNRVARVGEYVKLTEEYLARMSTEVADAYKGINRVYYYGDTYSKVIFRKGGPDANGTGYHITLYDNIDQYRIVKPNVIIGGE